MAYKITVDLIPGLPEKPYRNGVGAFEGVVAHSTATPEATDEKELIYFKNNWKKRSAFAHFFVDWDSITQMAKTDYTAWGAGNGNPRYVHVELCETKDEAKFKESYKRYVWLLAHILLQRKLTVKNGVTLVSHAWVTENLGGTTHIDPEPYLKQHKQTWAQLVKDVTVEYAAQSVSAALPTKPAVKPPTKPANKAESKPAPKAEIKPTKKYTSIVDYLKAHKQPYDFVSRVKLAKKYGIAHYNGSPEQNIRLLNMLQK